jgi:hypothetical protein
MKKFFVLSVCLLSFVFSFGAKAELNYEDQVNEAIAIVQGVPQGPESTGPCCLLNDEQPWTPEGFPNNPAHQKLESPWNAPTWCKDCLENAWSVFVRARVDAEEAFFKEILSPEPHPGPCGRCTPGLDYFQCDCLNNRRAFFQNWVDINYQAYKNAVIACGPPCQPQ